MKVVKRLLYCTCTICQRRKKAIKWLEKNNHEAIEPNTSDNMKYFIQNSRDFHATRNDYIVGLNDPYDDKNKWDTTKEMMYFGLYAKAIEV